MVKIEISADALYYIMFPDSAINEFDRDRLIAVTNELIDIRDEIMSLFTNEEIEKYEQLYKLELGQSRRQEVG